MSSASIGGQMVRSPSSQALDQAIRKDVQPRVKNFSEDSESLGSKVANFMKRQGMTILCGIGGLLGIALVAGAMVAPFVVGMVAGSGVVIGIGVGCLILGMPLVGWLSKPYIL